MPLVLQHENKIAKVRLLVEKVKAEHEHKKLLINALLEKSVDLESIAKILEISTKDIEKFSVENYRLVLYLLSYHILNKNQY